jgi:hypothetical protein
MRTIQHRGDASSVVEEKGFYPNSLESQRCDLLSSNVTKRFLYADNLESHRCDLVCPRLKKKVHFPYATGIYAYQIWEWLIITSFPYLVVLITSPLPSPLHISLGFTFDPMFTQSLDSIN